MSAAVRLVVFCDDDQCNFAVATESEAYGIADERRTIVPHIAHHGMDVCDRSRGTIRDKPCPRYNGPIHDDKSVSLMSQPYCVMLQ